MKNIIALLLIIYSLPAISQKRETEKLVLTYTELPLTPLSGTLKTYNKEVTYTGSKITNALTREQIKFFLSIPGYEQSDDGDMVLEAHIGEYDVREKEMVKVSTSSAFDVAAPDGSQPNYTYEITQKLPVKLVISTKGGEKIYEEYIDNSDVFKPGRMDRKFLDRASLQTYWSGASAAILSEMEKNLLESHLYKIKQLLASKYGYSKRKVNIEIHSFKTKKEDYSDLDMAQQAAMKGYQHITLGHTPEQAEFELQKAVDIWEGALAEYSQGSERVNEKVAEALLYNCAIASIWLTHFDEAEKYMVKSEEIKKYTPWTDYWRKILNEQKIRYEVNYSKAPH